MKNRKICSLAAGLTAVLALTTVTTTGTARASILPENNLAAQDGLFSSNMTEQQFNEIIDHVIDIWKPLAGIHGAELVVIKNWNDSTVNAYAQESGNKWMVTMFGGLARREEITPDALALVVCHELGHHFGGYAFKSGGWWAATEGEADYFATQVCAKRLWADAVDYNIAMARQNGAHLSNACDSIYKDDAQRALCYRTTEASLSLAALFGALSGQTKPTIETRDTTEVEQTSDYHPASQCRLDTYFQGALCAQQFNLNVIPGRPEGNGHTNNDQAAEMEAAKYSCMQAANFQVGYRPRCWFKPLVTNAFDGDDNNNNNNNYGITAWSKF